MPNRRGGCSYRCGVEVGWSVEEPFGVELLVESTDGSGDEVGIGGIEGSAGDGVFELALNGSDQGFGGRAEVHGCWWIRWDQWGLVIGIGRL